MEEENVVFVDENGKPFDVPTDGSLGLLAMGHVGLTAWRAKRKQEGVDLKADKEKEWKEKTEKVEKRKKEIAAKRKEIKAKKEKEKAEDGKTDS